MARSSTSFRPKWNANPTRVIRVPETLAQDVLDYAHRLDLEQVGKVEESPSAYTTSRVVDTRRPVNVASVPQRSPFRYPGGKTWLIPIIRQWLGAREQQASLLIEPFAGGGIVSLTAGFEMLAEHVILCEMDPSIAAVWQVILNGQAEWLAQKICRFELTERNVKTVLNADPQTLRERAFEAIVRNRVQRGGIMAPGAGLVKAGENGRGLSSRWYPETLARRMRDIHAVRGRFSFIEGDGFELIEKYIDEERAMFFVDPPYTVAAKRLYNHWEIDHRRLFQLLADAKGEVLLTYDNTREVEELAANYGFETHPVAMKNTHHAKMTELLIGKNLDWLKAAEASFESDPQKQQGLLEFPL